MLGYVIFLITSLIVISVVNGLWFVGLTLGQATLYTIALASFIFIVDAFVAYVIHKLPASWFTPDHKLFHVFKWERKFYEALGIKKWKDKTPDTGQLCDFKKDTLKSTENSYLEKFMVESCYAECIHFSMLLSGFLCLLICPQYILNICLPLAMVNLMLNLPSSLIQRYVRPKLMTVYRHNKRKEERALKNLLNEENVAKDNSQAN